MLEDHKRTGAYYMACMQNRAQFADKVVLDVGTGSGILAIFAAKAGARKVYAVEATSMAQFAKRLVTAQGLDGVVEVIQGTVETVELPEKVDLIISEWMGYFLLRESMLDSVLVARDRFLKPGGAMYPSHARMYLAPVRSAIARQRSADQAGAMQGWGEFLEEMQQFYGVDLACLSEDYRKEQRQYYSCTSAWTDIHPSQMLGPPALVKAYDLLKVTVEELKAPLTAELTLTLTENGPIEAFAGFFDTQFNGSPENPTDMPVTLSTAPDPTGATHWGQQSFFLHPGVECRAGDKVECKFEMRRQRENHRLMEVTVEHRTVGPTAGEQAQRVSHFLIE